ncbi:OadG family protein [Congregibacter variabilis]|uniref:Probable oxaloacetate decarboxylase gamma chain n=1 Tax=Congregibacter variabilis TaxID=3081200 RepID=A0ABZ0I810_9GAMM|nr:OadG family protein [Congregibacter sp. IMCC43200]
MSANLLSQGLELLVYGMGTVVVFLTLLVFATRLMSLFIQRFFPEPLLATPRRSARPPQASSAPSPELLAAIAAAVHQHRGRGLVSSASDLDQRKAHV